MPRISCTLVVARVEVPQSRAKRHRREWVVYERVLMLDAR